jgi:hypothetical protein
MTAVIFVGPTLPADTAAQLLPDSVRLPPAAHGDIYRVAMQRPRPQVIALIDGVFGSVPAVRHKEILWAMSQGIHVFGAASMGALRAAELAEFGMVGIGTIFEDFRCGRLEDDDEVAIDHAPAELGYLELSDAMVNIRATLIAATNEGIISDASRDAITATAKAIYYRQRTYANLLERSAMPSVPPAQIDALRRWLPLGRINQKQRDACQLLNIVSEFTATDPSPLVVSYRFARSEMWESDSAWAAPIGSAADEAALLREDLLDELRLDPELYRDIREAALARAFALREADRQGIELSDREQHNASRAWLRRVGRPGQDWCAANHLDDAAFAEFVTEEERKRRLEALAAPLIERHIVNALRARGEFAALAARTIDKNRVLATRGASEATISELGLSLLDLLSWYFETRLRRPIPQDIDDFAATQGFSDAARFYRAVLHEYLHAIVMKPRIEAP